MMLVPFAFFQKHLFREGWSVGVLRVACCVLRVASGGEQCALAASYALSPVATGRYDGSVLLQLFLAFFWEGAVVALHFSTFRPTALQLIASSCASFVVGLRYALLLSPGFRFYYQCLRFG